MDTLITHDKFKQVDVRLRDDGLGCAYQGHEFGAPYLDSLCIEGYLWDADSGDASGDGAGWNYTHGGELPCPHCNHAQWLEKALESLDDEGYDAQSKGVLRDQCPHPQTSRFAHEGMQYQAAWLKGWDEAFKADEVAVIS
jgi:ribosome modulation factor